MEETGLSVLCFLPFHDGLMRFFAELTVDVPIPAHRWIIEAEYQLGDVFAPTMGITVSLLLIEFD